jgi:MFS family permease
MGGESSIPATTSAAALPAPLHLRYFSLLRRNPNFRRLWLAQLISELGDWFYSLAVYDLLLKQTHRSGAVGWAIIIQTLPWFFMTPLAGYIADRFPRRTLMILADIFQGFVVLGLLIPSVASSVHMIYLLLGLEVVFASIFEPARSALLPNVVSEEEILPANALSSATWSFALTVGAALGGAVTALLGRDIAFAANSASFFVSAILITRISLREGHFEPAQVISQGVAGAAASVREGLEYVRTNGKVLALLLAKTGVGILGGSLLLLVIFGERIFPLAGRGALAVGLLYAARGVGAGVGPLLGDRLSKGLESRMWKIIGISFFLIAAAYMAFSRAPNLWLGIFWIFLGSVGGSNIWVMSTSLLQLNTPDQVRGRVFSLDFGLLMLMIAVSNFLIGQGLDSWGFTARELAAALGAVMILPGILWFGTRKFWKAGAA